jgi:O-antigen/teichoic acid export membrane protein
MMASGLLVPRLIDHRLGRELLGVWDLSWSLALSLTVMQSGFGATVGRFVAGRRAVDDGAGLNTITSSAACLFVGMAVLVAAATVLLAALVPTLWRGRLGPHTAEAQAVVLLLGLAMAVQVSGQWATGVLTGCHRWEIHNAVTSGAQILILAGMLIILAQGNCRLHYLAAAYLVVQCVERLVRISLVRHICPDLQVRPGLATRDACRRLLHHGGKSLLSGSSWPVVSQGVALAIGSTMGPAPLALYARAQALARIACTLVLRYVAVLRPTASALHACGRHEDLQHLLSSASRTGAYIALPPLLVLGLQGDNVLHVWMGAQYANAAVTAALALGTLGFVMQQPSIGVLAGMNRHGRPSALSLGGAVAAVTCSTVAALVNTGLAGVALSAAVPLAVFGFLVVPRAACRVVQMPFGEFLRDCWTRPLLSAAPLACSLLAAQWILDEHPALSLCVGGGVGAFAMVPLYWRALPRSWRQRLTRRIGLQRTSRPAAPSAVPKGPQ